MGFPTQTETPPEGKVSTLPDPGARHSGDPPAQLALPCPFLTDLSGPQAVSEARPQTKSETHQTKAQQDAELTPKPPEGP